MRDDEGDKGMCSAGGCFERAAVVSVATVTLPPEVGATSDDDPLVLEVPLCEDHAHLLRMGVTKCDLDSRLT